MKRKVRTIRSLTIALSLLAFVITPSVCKAQEWSRKGKGEIFGVIQTMSGDKTTFSGAYYETGEMDDTTAYGFGFGWNLNDHLNLNTDLLFGFTDITQTRGATTVTSDTDLFIWDINLDYNILKDRLTPMVTGGIGFIRFSGVVYDEVGFSYNFGAGLRWDVRDNLSIKAMYRGTWTEWEYGDRMLLDGITVSIACMF